MTSLLRHDEYFYFQRLSQADVEDLMTLDDQEHRVIETACQFFALTDQERGSQQLQVGDLHKLCLKLNRKEGRASHSRQHAEKLVDLVRNSWTQHLEKIDLKRPGLLTIDGELASSSVILIGDTQHSNLVVKAVISACVQQFERSPTLLLEGLSKGKSAEPRMCELTGYHFKRNIKVVGWDDETLNQKHRELDQNADDFYETAYAMTDHRTKLLIETILQQKPELSKPVMAIAGNDHLVRNSGSDSTNYDIRKHLTGYSVTHIIVHKEPHKKMMLLDFHKEYQNNQVNKVLLKALAVLSFLGSALMGTLLLVGSFSIAVVAVGAILLLATLFSANQARGIYTHKVVA